MSAPGTNRRLATILFADVAGYSRMMRADEEQTFVDLRAHLDELVAPVVGRFNGRIVKTVGDGVLVEFGSAVKAVRAAVELHLTQGAVSKQIMELEQSLGVALFTRERKRLFVSAAGQRHPR